jgi:acetoin utilization deacetylase AcuC-like enzyme
MRGHYLFVKWFTESHIAMDNDEIFLCTGNGVEAAFECDSRVMTFSLHLHEPGYFPCTGALSDVGQGPGKFYSINVPFKAGLCDKNLHLVFQK